ncbi:MAG: hypothetical protein OXI73_02645 [Rhodospirillales bacterium]|nr:hypothetical protein [Rhodospirillales bacterium]
MHDHLSLRRWPFFVVPEPSRCDFIADREHFRDDVEKLLRTLSRQNASSIHPIWSWFGAGKTHTLHYISNKAAQLHEHGASHLATVYSEFPRNPRSFVDVYKSFALQLDRELLSDAYLEITTAQDAERLERDLLQTSSDLACALKVLVIGNAADKELAMRWVRAEPLPVADCRKLGISRRIISSEDSTRALIGIVRVFGLSAASQNQVNSRLIWQLDELQRIDELPPRVRHEINTGLHSTFNACPTGLTMILSFSGHPSESLPEWFSPELKDRIGRTKVMILPPMNRNDAMKFVRDVLQHSRPEDGPGPEPYFPFTEETCGIIIDDITDHGDLKPRAIMQAFDAVLREADMDIETGRIKVIAPSFARKILSELVKLE